MDYIPNVAGGHYPTFRFVLLFELFRYLYVGVIAWQLGQRRRRLVMKLFILSPLM